jgi:hypothetical protein
LVAIFILNADINYQMEIQGDLKIEISPQRNENLKQKSSGPPVGGPPPLKKDDALQ